MVGKQQTLFGGVAKEDTYYNHKPESRFEKFVEAFYYFNRSGRTKNQVYKIVRLINIVSDL